MRILISAGEASGDLYAARLVEILKARHPDAEFFGIAGPRMQAAGVRTIVDQRELAVVGLLSIVPHIPRIFGIFRRLTEAAAREKPDLAILTDSAGLHLRVAKRLKRLGIPVVQLIAPQAWAWREYRVNTMRRTLRQLLCILPFEEKFFRDRGVPATYIGHPLTRLVKPKLSRAELCAQLGIPESARILAVLPGSRRGEVARHVPEVLDAAKQLRDQAGVVPVVALPQGFGMANAEFLEPFRSAAIHTVEGLTWDVLAHAELALSKSGSVNIEAAMLGTPMVTFYRANALDWYLGRWLVHVPFLSMVNLVAGRRVVAELIQHDMSPRSMVAECLRLLRDEKLRETMRAELAGLTAQLATERDPMENAAACIEQCLEGVRRETQVH
ncbi:MAG: lipid-A-disaccharide synthase [Acidobacteriota bacterium]